MAPSLFSLAFRAVVHIRSSTLSHNLSVFLTFRVIYPHPYHSVSQSQTFIFAGIAHIAFIGSRLSSFSSPYYPVFITYSSLLFQISISTAHDTVLRVQDTYFCHVIGYPTLVIFM